VVRTFHHRGTEETRLGIGDLLEGSTSKKDAEMSKPTSHRCALPIVAVLSGGFDRQLLMKAEFLFDDVEELGRKIEQIDVYFEEQ
jgi:hypothetical protein